MSTRPADMPDLRLDLIDHWTRDRTWHLRAMAAPPGATQPPSMALGVATEVEMLKDAELWFLSEEMCDLTYATMHSVPDDVKPEDCEPPSWHGLAVLAKPWVGIDSYGSDGGPRGDGKVYVHAVSWGATNLPHDAVIAGKDRIGDRVLCRSLSSYCDLSEMGMEATGAWAPLGRSDWPIGQPLAGLHAIVEDFGGDEATRSRLLSFADSSEDDRRFMAALFVHLNRARLTTVEIQHAPRHVRRRTERRKDVTAPNPSSVKVVWLRRPTEAPAEPGEHKTREYSHRFLVNGFWRNQPYGPQHSLRRLQWIDPFIKGDPSKPLVLKESVKAWVR